MTIRIWLNTAGERALEVAVQGRADLLKVDERMLRVDSENGCKYVNLNGDPNDPAMVFPAVPRKFIRRVTYMESYYTGFRTDGLYRLKGATARTETKERHHGHTDITIERWQNISVSAGSIKTLRQIYSKIRSGELKPVKDWEITEANLAHRQREAQTPTTEALTEH